MMPNKRDPRVEKKSALTPRLAAIFEELRKANDRLGAYSDHEGQEHGSTYWFWNKGQIAFDLQCNRAIEDHMIAIKVWRKLRRENQSRKESSNAE